MYDDCDYLTSWHNITLDKLHAIKINQLTYSPTDSVAQGHRIHRLYLYCGIRLIILQ